MQLRLPWESADRTDRSRQLIVDGEPLRVAIVRHRLARRYVVRVSPDGVLRLTVLVFRESPPLSFRFPLVPPPLPPPTPLVPLRSSILSPWLLGWSAIIDLPAAIFECCRDHACRTSPGCGDKVGARPRLSRFLMRKRQAANSGRGRTACHWRQLWISSLLSRV